MQFMSPPLVTVYITTKNRLELLKRAIESVVNQTYKHIEIIVCDDGSVDGTKKFLLEMESKKILRAIILPESKGACYARNQAINSAKGEFITGLDDDDWFSQERIENFVSTWADAKVFHKDNFSGLFSNSIEIIDLHHKKVYRRPTVEYADMRKGNLVGNQVFCPKSVLVDAGGFDNDLPAWQDWDCWLRITEKYGALINCNSFTYYVDASHDSERISRKDPALIRRAYGLLISKMGRVSMFERAKLTQELCRYRQVRPSLVELIFVIFSGNFKLLPSAIKRVRLH